MQESDRQMLLLAAAVLSLESPGFTPALAVIAETTLQDPGAVEFYNFRHLRTLQRCCPDCVATRARQTVATREVETLFGLVVEGPPTNSTLYENPGLTNLRR